MNLVLGVLRAALAVAIVSGLAGCAARGPTLAHIVGESSPQRVELTEVPFFPQDEYQCGPAALATVLHHAGAPVTPQELVAKVYIPGRRGSLQAELIAATRAYERLPYLLAPTWHEVLTQVAAGHPVLVLQNVGLKALPAWHFAVVTGYDARRNTLVLRSGTTERLELDAKKFLRTWDRAQRWAMVALTPGDLPANADVDRYMTAAAGLEATGKLEAARRAYRAAQAHWPESAWPWLGLANIDYAAGRLRQAEEGYAKALHRDPANVIARNNLAGVLLDRGCTVSARAHIEIAAELVHGTALRSAIADTASRIAAQPNAPSAGDCPPPPPSSPPSSP